MRKILILAFSNLDHDARVARQVNFLKSDYKVTVASFEGSENNEYEVFRLKQTKLSLFRKITASFFLITRMYPIAYAVLHNYKYIKHTLGQWNFDLVIANDIETLPLAFEFGNAKVLFDAHEYAPRHFEDKLIWRFFFQGFNKYLCRQYIPRVNAMTTVGRGLAMEYKRNYGTEPTVITNSSPYYELNAFPVEEGKIKLIHHGIANRSRKLELMLEMMNFLDDRYTLDLMLILPPNANRKTRAYIDRLKELSSYNSRIRILPPVKSSEIVKSINKYDMGVFLIPPINFNYANTLPNKLFDFIQARLAIAIGPTPEMAELVRKYSIGVVADDFTPESLANAIRQIDCNRLTELKLNTSQAAKEVNAEKNKKILLSMVETLLQ
ncbi:MAG: hypothetical protein L0Y35_00430 [Flammeovirgaceae bacterium]|nr:hypothetical protein [Flammeovirgaceae bacterium]